MVEGGVERTKERRRGGGEEEGGGIGKVERRRNVSN